MKDDRGLFYYPFPANKRVRMYVRKEKNTVAFRLWNTDDPQLWEDHGWVPHEAILQAAAIYKKEKNGFDPGQAYDIELATEILKEDGKE